MSEQSETVLNKNRRRLRWFARGAFLVLAGVLLLAVQRRWPVVVPSLSPFIGLGALLATRALQVTALLGLAVVATALVRPRWFCRWVCPFGLCADGASRLGRELGRGRMKPSHPGQWVLWLTIGGASVGLPLLLWLDPLALLASIFRMADSPAAWIALIPAVAVLVMSLLWPYSWCSRVCPLGAFQDVLSRLGRHKGSRGVSGGTRPVTRRALLGVTFGATAASILRMTSAALGRPVRPPGAVEEAAFVGVCIRCGNCARACPERIIKTDLGGHGLRSLLTPALDFQEAYCLEDCTACTTVCPSGALAQLSKKEKGRFPLGVPKLDLDLCLLVDEQECSECRRWCPHEAIRYVFSETEYTLVPMIDTVKCTGCGACEMACPVEPRRAIVVIPLAS